MNKLLATVALSLALCTSAFAHCVVARASLPLQSFNSALGKSDANNGQ